MKKPKLNAKLQRIVKKGNIEYALNGTTWANNPYGLSRRERLKLIAYRGVYKKLFHNV